MISALIVEDEERNARVLKNLIEEYCHGIKLIGSCNTVKSALVDIPKLQPELVFMDVMLSDGNAFDILSQLKERNFEIIFTTAHDEFAIKAIKFSALDYIVKPVGIEELKEAVKKIGKKSFEQLEAQRYDVLLQNIKSNTGKLQRIAVPTLEGHSFIDIKDIVRFEADGSYTNIYLVSKEKILVSRPIKEYDTLLTPEGFFRIHHSHLINLSCVTKYVKGSGGYVIMIDGSSVEVALRRKEEFLKAIHVR